MNQANLSELFERTSEIDEILESIGREYNIAAAENIGIYPMDYLRDSIRNWSGHDEADVRPIRSGNFNKWHIVYNGRLIGRVNIASPLRFKLIDDFFELEPHPDRFMVSMCGGVFVTQPDGLIFAKALLNIPSLFQFRDHCPMVCCGDPYKSYSDAGNGCTVFEIRNGFVLAGVHNGDGEPLFFAMRPPLFNRVFWSTDTEYVDSVSSTGFQLDDLPQLERLRAEVAKF